MHQLKADQPAATDLAGLDEWIEQQRGQKQKMGYAELTEVESFSFPTLFTAVFDYFATGEGQTIGILLGQAESAAELRVAVLETFNPYFGQGAQIWPELRVPLEKNSLVPDAVRTIVADPTQITGRFRYASLWHLNKA